MTKKTSYFVYILECKDMTLYCGITTDLERRLLEHNNSPLGASYTSGRRPVILVYSEICKNKSKALKREYTLKKLSRSEKLHLISGAK